MKRIISGLTAVIIALCLAAPFSYAEEKRFTATDNSYTSVSGYATREQAVACFIKAVGIERFKTDDTILNRFSDKSKVSFAYREEMSAAVFSGLISGYEDRTLRPQEPITRIEALVILARALSRTELSNWYSVEFTDTPDWAQKQVSRLAAAGIVKGYGDGTLGARDYLTLEQVNTLCDRIIRLTGPVGDYYNYVNSEWLENAEVSGDSPVYSDSVRLSQMVNSNISDIIYSLYRRYYNDGEQFAEDSKEKRIINVYSAAANQGYRDKIGIAPIKSYLDAVDGAADIGQLTAVMAELEKAGFPVLVSVKAGSNIYDTSVYLPTVSTGYIGIDAAYADDEAYVASYKKYISELFRLSGEAEPEALSEQAAEVCMAVAASVENPADDVISKSVNVYEANKFTTVFKNLDIKRYLEYLGMGGAKNMLVFDRKFTDAADTMFVQENMEKIKAFLKAAILDSSATYLTGDMFYAAQEFQNSAYGSKFNYIPADYSTAIAQEIVGWELGAMYIDMYFPDTVKAAALDMTQKIISEYERQISSCIIMMPQTKAKALNKLKTMKIYAAYPDDISAYCSSDILFRPIEEGGSLMEYKIQCNRKRNEYYARLAASGQPVENDSWMIYPQTVNAMYDPVSNSITIPAGILQPPYFETGAEFEENLGGIGSVIAHEISHAFDSVGSQFDENGNLNNWWTEQDAAAFQNVCREIIGAYDGLASFGGTVDGKLTLNENLADIAGMSCVIGLAGGENPKLGLLFSSYAEVWRTKMTDEYGKTMLKTDPHSPAKIRVNRVLSNFDAFINHYGIIEGDGMYIPEDKRIKIYN